MIDRPTTSLSPSVGALVFCILLAPGAALRAEDDKVDFVRDIQPIFQSACYECHADKKAKGRLRLDSRDLALQGGTTGPAILPGKGRQSYLVQRLRGEGDEDPMPLDKPPLPEEQIRLIERWIDQGAAWPQHASVQQATIEQHWAFIPPIKPSLPRVSDSAWPRNPIDHFILARLEREGFRPSSEADRHTLIRRLSLDLIGLPPSVDEVDAFVSDRSPDAYERLVDRLLASPHYGERWARRWLDLARYADTNGYEKDRPRSIWPYRDWVINAINADMPFDQFTIEQIAGDMLSDATPDQRIATGFHRNTMLNEEGGIDPLEYRYHAIVDRVATTGAAWLGLTIACAQCHNHKHDPISQKEYYQFMAFLNNADEPDLEVPSPDIEARRAQVQEKIDQLTAELPEKFPVERVLWQTPPTAAVHAAAGEQAEQLPDGSWRFDSDGPEKETYTIEFESSGEEVDRIRLETLTDGQRGPGRTPHGNFVLSEITVTVAPKDAPDQRQQVKLASAQADFSQNGFPIQHAIDGDPRTGWAVDGQGKKSRAATFRFESPMRFPQGARWTIKLDQQHGQHHTIARLRLSLGKPIDDPRPIDLRRREALERSFAEWQERESNRAVQWRVLRPDELSSSMPILTFLDDDSILASGDITKSDTYELAFREAPGGITAIRLEALPHESLPKRGPGKIYYEGPIGDFFLSEITLSADGRPASFAAASHSFASGGNVARNAIDGDPQSGWSINGAQGRPSYAIFSLVEPTPKTAELKLRMLFERYYAAPLGRFRISVTTDPRAADKPTVLPPEIEQALAIAVRERSQSQQEAIFRYYLSIAPELAEARRQIDALRNSMPQPPTTLVMRERPPGHARPTHIHHRGEFLQPRDAVEPAVPAVLPPLPNDMPADRLGFARWLVWRQNPLTARVIVNRHWAAIFGGGIVRTVEDFGTLGERPSHPELLDWLAVEFMDRRWSLKQLHRLIVTSAAYRQSSRVSPELIEKDPENTLLARGPRFRLEAELIRDSALKAGGLLSSTLGGPSVFPPQPASITTEGTYGPLQWKASTGADRFRRSIYTFAKRTAPFALYHTFDAPSGEQCLARRDMTNTPLQALSLLNDTVFIEAAQALGRNIATLPGSDEQRASSLFQRCLARAPDEQELSMLVDFCRAQRQRFQGGELDAARVAGSEDGDPVERATWTVAARAVLNLDAMVTKN